MAQSKEKWPSSGPIEKERQNVPGRPVLMIAIGHHGAEEADEDAKGNAKTGAKGKGKTCPTCGGSGTC